MQQDYPNALKELLDEGWSWQQIALTYFQAHSPDLWNTYFLNDLKLIDESKIKSLDEEYWDAIKAKDSGFYECIGNTNKPLYYKMADYYKHCSNLICVDGAPWFYEDGYYKKKSFDEIWKQIVHLTNEKADPNTVDKFLKAIIKKNYYGEKLDHPPGMINLKNGALCIKKNKLHKHSRAYHFTYKLPHEYVEGASCPVFKEWLKRAFKGSDKLCDIVFEMLGYVLLGDYQKFAKAFVFLGREQTGKSTMLRVINNLLGDENISNLSLDDLSHRFRLQDLDGKLANTVGELPDKPISASLFKTITGNDKIMVEEKHRKPYSTILKAKFLMSSNDYLKFSDSKTSLALARRIIYLPFDVKIKDSEVDTNMYDKISNEMSGIINEAIIGLKRLEQNDKFTECSESINLKEDFMRETDSVYNWIKENMAYAPEANRKYTLRRIYSSYRADCEDDGCRPVKKMEFFRRFRVYIEDTAGIDCIQKPRNIETLSNFKIENIDSNIFG